MSTNTDGAPLGSGAMFDALADRYDRMNRILSFGIDGRWRAAATRALALGPGARVLDVATGTGDLAIAIARAYPDGVEVHGVDPSLRMLDVARAKVVRAGLLGRVSLALGDAEALDFGDARFDAVTIAFGIRNVPNRARALREMRRVVRPGGRVVVLELGEPEGPVLGALARWHVHTLVPALGAALSGAREYRYLERSIRAFPSRADFAEMMQGSGLEVLRVDALTLGAASLFVTVRPVEGAA